MSRSSDRSSSATRASSSTSATCSCRPPGSGSTRTRPGLHLRAVGEAPAAADAQGIGVYAPALRLRRSSAGCWPVWPGRPSRIAISPGWFGDQTVNGRGWIAVGLVIFAQWSPIRAAFGAYLFGAIFRFILDLQGVDAILSVPTPSWQAGAPTFFLEMLPYLMVILVVIIGSREAVRKRHRGAGRAWAGRTCAGSAAA